MIETHPFGDFVPENARYMLLGSFLGKRSAEDIRNGYDWYYGTKRNQFWPIMSEALGVELKTKAQKEDLFRKLRMTIGDIIYSCERIKGSNLDMNLINIVFNIKGINKILRDHKIEKVFFTSRFVEKHFRKLFKELLKEYPELELVTLPSPSPRYAAMTRQEKVSRYREALSAA